MWHAFKRWLAFWVAQKTMDDNLALKAENLRLRNEVVLGEKQLKLVKDDLISIEDDRKKLLDWIMVANGAPTLYSQTPTKPNVGPQRRLDSLSNLSQGRDFARIASQMESEAFSDTEFRR